MDTNILFPLVVQDHPRHEEAAAFAESLREREDVAMSHREYQGLRRLRLRDMAGETGSIRLALCSEKSGRGMPAEFRPTGLYSRKKNPSSGTSLLRCPQTNRRNVAGRVAFETLRAEVAAALPAIDEANRGLKKKSCLGNSSPMKR